MKDAQGHGSNARGGSYPNIERSAFRKGEHVGYGGGAWRIKKYGGGATTYMATHQQTGTQMYGRSLGEISQKLTDASTSKGPGEVHVADLAAQHGVSGPAVGSASPKADAYFKNLETQQKSEPTGRRDPGSAPGRKPTDL